MKRARAVVIGIVVGLCIAGILASLTVVLAPDPWRGERAIWAGTAVVVALSVWVAWRMAARASR
jgi:hypothetical protein